MNATVNVVLFKSKTLADGSHPLMIRICKNNKKKYKSIGISIQPQFWDFEKNKPKRNCPNKDNIQTIIREKTKEFSEQIIEFKAINKDFTASSLIEKVDTPTVNNTVQQLFNTEIHRLKQENRLKTASIYKELLTSMIEFNTHLDIYFSEIDIIWLRQYEAFLRKKGLSDNSLGVRFRTLRGIYNKAIEINVVKQEYYPFKIYKVSKLHKETAKRAISKSDIETIINYNADSEYTRLAIDLFYFSYLSGGINFVDIAHLTRSNIVDDRLVYTRKKTKKLIKIPLQLKAIELIDKYSSDNFYLFPILTLFHKTEQQKVNRVHKVLAIINKRLKDIGKELNIPINLTSYVARHTQATQLKKSGVSTAIISELMGHSSEKITQIYLDSFSNSQIDEAMKNLL